MIRRWSRLNNFNFSFTFSFSAFFLPKFDVYKLIKAANYKKYSIGPSKFRRKKLSRWKRRGNWLAYAQVMKHWIWDYNVHKQLVKSQFLDSIFLNASYVYNFSYIKRKNPLNVQMTRPFLLNSLSKPFYFYFYNKFKNRTSLTILQAFANSNFLLVYALNSNFDFLFNEPKLLPVAIRAENNFYAYSGNTLEKNTNLQLTHAFSFFFF